MIEYKAVLAALVINCVVYLFISCRRLKVVIFNIISIFLAICVLVSFDIVRVDGYNHLTLIVLPVLIIIESIVLRSLREQVGH